MDKQTHSDPATITKVPIGRYITEILYSRNLTPHYLSQKVDFGKKDTVYSCLRDERRLSPNELQQISDILHVPIERLKQTDLEQEAFELRLLVRSKQRSPRAIDLGLKLQKLALGWTEKFDILNDLGSAYYYMDKFPQAHQAWLEALPLAEKIRDTFSETDRLYMVTNNLILTYTQKQDFSALTYLLDKVETAFTFSNPKRAGLLATSSAIIATEMGDYEKAQQKWQEAFEQFERTNDQSLIGKGYHNLAYYEFRVGNFAESHRLFAKALHALTPDPIPHLIAIGDYLKTLIKLKETDTALHMIAVARSIRELESLPDLQAKFHILESVATGNPQLAESVLQITEAGPHLKLMACKWIMHHLSHQGDADKLLRYYKKAEQFDKNVVTHWEEL
ncbi:tetratricopeptide repeat protein [Tumebacillus permanentifrigoris]|uniref:Tetratricopeptide repeat protein n=1 Tax=Tumebacillus permanentifrigoris TaxID=378543 RepID=A0A316DAP8_9BACL|nr:tetratricopeptide repeat protein [Tumebacillus permanentifrigoris]PWK13477.1 hypothetical protein C7459_107145 [Tumebacillus permanentifrigoris]